MGWSGVLPDRRQREGEATALTHGGFYTDGAAVMLDDFLADCQTEAGSLVLGRDRVTRCARMKFFKEVGQFMFGNARSRVANRDGDASVVVCQ